MKNDLSIPLTDRLRRDFGRFLAVVELAGLILIGLATAFAIAQEAWKVISSGDVSLTDLLLMFLYLEVLEMNVRYLRQGQLPVRFPLIIAMASLARDLILRGMGVDAAHLLMTTLGIVFLALSVYILRFAQPARGRDEICESGIGSREARVVRPRDERVDS